MFARTGIQSYLHCPVKISPRPAKRTGTEPSQIRFLPCINYPLLSTTTTTTTTATITTTTAATTVTTTLPPCTPHAMCWHNDCRVHEKHSLLRSFLLDHWTMVKSVVVIAVVAIAHLIYKVIPVAVALVEPSQNISQWEREERVHLYCFLLLQGTHEQIQT